MAASLAAAQPSLIHGHEQKLAVLDLARACAAAWVLAAHLSIMLGHPVRVLSEGRIPVDVFIFLSGFLMFHLLSRERGGWTWQGAWGFYVRRFFRIAPCFYFALLLYVGFRAAYLRGLIRAEDYLGTAGVFSGYVAPLGASDLLLHLTFLHGVHPSRATVVFGPAWTLSLEMQFYAVAPFVASWLKQRPATTLFGAFVVNAAAWALFGSYGHLGWYSQHTFPAMLPDRLFLFCFGSAASLYYADPTRRHAGLLALTAGGSLLLFPFDSTLLCMALTACLLLIARAPANGFARRLQRVAAARATGLAAEWSYALYLVHQFCLALAALLLWHWLGPGPSSTATILLYVLTTVALSVLSAAAMFTVIERPARQLGKRLAHLPLVIR